MNVLITGASGFIGQFLVERLIREKLEVICVSRKKRDFKNSGENNTFNIDLVSDSLDLIEQKVDVIINLASLQPKDNSITWAEYYKANVEIVRNLWKFSEKKRVQQFIHVSTTSIYGPINNKFQRINEDSKIEPQNFYCLSKSLGEQLLKILNFSSNFGVKCCVLRFSSVFGKNQNGGLIDSFYSLAIKSQDIEIYNKGSNYRNFLYVSQAVEAICSCLKERENLSDFDAFVIGSSDSLKTIDIARLIVSKTNSLSSLIPIGKSSSVKGNIVLDQSKAKAKLNYFPVSIEEGINLYLESFNQ